MVRRLIVDDSGVVLGFVFAPFPAGAGAPRLGSPSSAVVAVPGLALGPPADEAFAPGTNPIAIDASVADVLAGLGQTPFVIGFVLSGASLVVRLRRSQGVESASS